MDGLTLLREARVAGLRVTVSGDRLVVQGPRRLEPIARQLLAEKRTIVEALTAEQEVAWRIDAMRPQVTRSGAIPLLLARPVGALGLRTCCSCGEPLAPAERYRCRPCVAAAVAVLEPTQ
ncbi:MAG: hypothetical protein WEG56_05300 [Chloroflexota bacterium]